MTERHHKTKDSVYTHKCQQTNPICQQELRGCRQSVNRHPTFCLSLFMAFHLLIGIISIGFTHDVHEYKIRYDDKCNLSEENPTGTADIYFNNPPLFGNLFFYFELHDYYQAYFLMDREFGLNEAKKSFEEYPTKCEIGNNKTSSIPCEILDKTFFIDNYKILNGNFSESDISWLHEKRNLYSEVDKKYENSSMNFALHPNISDYFPGETLNEHFIVWMRLSANHNFRKLYAKSKDGCEANLHVQVHCLYSYNFYHGQRYLVLLQPDGLGGKTVVLAALNFAFTGVILIFIITFEVIKYVHKKNRRRKLRNLTIESIDYSDGSKEMVQV